MKNFVPYFLIFVGIFCLLSFTGFSLTSPVKAYYVFLLLLMGLGCLGSGIMLILANKKI